MIAIEKPQLPKLPKLNYGEGTFAYTDNGVIAYKGNQAGKENTSKYIDHVDDPDFIPVMINKEALIDKSVVSTEMWDRFAERGFFSDNGCRVMSFVL